MIYEMINKGQGARVRGQGNETVSLRALVSLRAGFMSLREEPVSLRTGFMSLREEPVSLRTGFMLLRGE